MDAMESRVDIAAKNLKIAAIGYAVKHGDKRLEKKLLGAAVKYAEERARMDAFKALLDLGAVNAHEADRVMRGRQAREVPPGLTKAIRKAKREVARRDLLLGRFNISKMPPFQKEVLGGVNQYGHKPEDRQEERVMHRFVELGLIEPCSGPRKRHYRLTSYGHEVWSVVSREMPR